MKVNEFALHVPNQGLVPGVPYGSLSSVKTYPLALGQTWPQNSNSISTCISGLHFTFTPISTRLPRFIHHYPWALVAPFPLSSSINGQLNSVDRIPGFVSVRDCLFPVSFCSTQLSILMSVLPLTQFTQPDTNKLWPTVRFLCVHKFRIHLLPWGNQAVSTPEVLKIALLITQATYHFSCKTSQGCTPLILPPLLGMVQPITGCRVWHWDYRQQSYQLQC